MKRVGGLAGAAVDVTAGVAGDVTGEAEVLPMESITPSGFAVVGRNVVGLMVEPGIVGTTVAGANVDG